MESLIAARVADELDYWSECEEDSFHYVYFHTESCNGMMHTVQCNKPEHHDLMITLDVCTENCAVYQRQHLLNNAEEKCLGDYSGTTRNIQQCDTEKCNGYMHTVTCLYPARHDRMASFFICNENCEIYQQRKRNLEKRMTTPAVPVPPEYLDPERIDVDEVDVPISEQDTVIIEENAACVPDGLGSISDQDTLPLDGAYASNSVVRDADEENAMDTDEWLNRKTSDCTQPETLESLKAIRRRERKKRQNTSAQKKRRREGKKRILGDDHVVFVLVEEPHHGESESDA